MKNHAWSVKADCSFGTFYPETPDHRAAYNAMRLASSVVVSYADQLVKSPEDFAYNKFIYLGGGANAGKSHLQNAFVNRIRDEAEGLIFEERIELWHDNKGHDDFVGEFANPPIKLPKAPVILVDDLLEDVRRADDLPRDPRIGAALVNFLVAAEMAKKTVVIASRLPFAALQETMRPHDTLGVLHSDFLTTRATITDLQRSAWGTRQSVVRTYGPGDIEKPA